MRLQIHSPPAKPHPFSLQSQPLFHRRIALQLDLAACAQHTLPRQSKSAPQNRCYLPCCPGKTRRPRDPAIRRDSPARNRADRLLDPQTRRASIIPIGLSRQRTAAFPFQSVFALRKRPGFSTLPHSLWQRWDSLRRRPKRFQRLILRVVNVKHRQQLGDLQQVAHALGQVRQFDAGPGDVRRGMQPH
jgi:hypothetical protein